MRLVRLLGNAHRQLIAVVCDRLDQWVMDFHAPVDFGEPACPRCRKEWPCDEFTKAADRFAARHARPTTPSEESLDD